MKTTQNYVALQKRRVNFFYYIYKAYKAITTKRLNSLLFLQLPK